MGCNQTQTLTEVRQFKLRRCVSLTSKFISLNQQFEFISMVGNGSFGKVRLYRDKYWKDILFAIKTIKKGKIDDESLNDLLEEVKILSSLDHPNIVKYYGTVEDVNFLHIQMEYLKGNNFIQIIALKNFNVLDETNIAKIFYQLFKALIYIHDNNIIHRDIKPENIVFGNTNDFSTLKLIDFGLATNTAEHPDEKSQCGTPYYMSPELINGKATPKTDIWAVGVTLFKIFTGEYPFEGSPTKKLFNNIINKKLDTHLLLKKNCSNKLQDFIVKLLEKDENKRLSAAECIQHPWIKEIIFEPDSLITNKIYDIMLKFSKKNALQKEIYFFFAKLRRSDDLHKSIELFNQFDYENKGCIHKENIFFLFKSFNSNENSLSILWNGLDFHYKGYINYSEFLASIMELYPSGDNNKIKELFSFFIDSTDINLSFNKETFIKKADNLNIQINKEQINLFFFNNKIDNITFDYFTKLILC